MRLLLFGYFVNYILTLINNRKLDRGLKPRKREKDDGDGELSEEQIRDTDCEELALFVRNWLISIMPSTD